MTTAVYSKGMIYSDTRQTSIDVGTGKIVEVKDVCKAVNMNGWIVLEDGTRYHVTRAVTVGTVSHALQAIKTINETEAEASLYDPVIYGRPFSQDYTLLMLTSCNVCIVLEGHGKPKLVTSTYAAGSGCDGLPVATLATIVGPKLAVQMAAYMDRYTGGSVEAHNANATQSLGECKDYRSAACMAVTVALLSLGVLAVIVPCLPIIVYRLCKPKRIKK